MPLPARRINGAFDTRDAVEQVRIDVELPSRLLEDRAFEREAFGKRARARERERNAL